MQQRSVLSLALLAAALVATPTIAPAATPSAAPVHTARPDQAAVDHDFSRLSRDGLRAYADIDLARQALAQGDKGAAGTFLADANTALARAQTDNHAFTRAESALTPAPHAPQGTPGKTPDPASAAPAVTWIPVDAEYVVSSDPAAAPTDKTQAAKTASQHLKKGESAAAAQSLKAADIDVDFVMIVAPLQTVTADVYRASNLVHGADTTAADQALQDAQNATRFVADDMVFVPKAPKA
ncbi:YfdX family protein [Gluconacetobacter tumulisoli]|uniref:YfdX family protein n=1 Tax=Gluconacetobacter tumulisoli TaxID=1286189 RepID=A0A7W4K5D2_9PROT|nr:YfdX family protein [Gluconacetobacter tumulisoli]MBB2200686.1 YfdX family protein [Gluconacetobacter tumulisoli]